MSTICCLQDTNIKTQQIFEVKWWKICGIFNQISIVNKMLISDKNTSKAIILRKKKTIHNDRIFTSQDDITIQNVFPT